jgi:hypothetical protein
MPRPLSLVFPLCATIGSSAVPAPGRVDFQKFVRRLHHRARHAARPIDDVRVTPTRIPAIATAQQPKVFD